MDDIGIGRKAYFGEFSELVATHLDKSLAEINRVIAERVARSRTEYEHKYGSLDEVHLRSIAESVERAYRPEKYTDQFCECPACGNMAMLSGKLDVEWEVDVDDEGHPEGSYPLVSLTH